MAAVPARYCGGPPDPVSNIGRSSSSRGSPSRSSGPDWPGLNPDFPPMAAFYCLYFRAAFRGPRLFRKYRRNGYTTSGIGDPSPTPTWVRFRFRVHPSERSTCQSAVADATPTSQLNRFREKGKIDADAVYEFLHRLHIWKAEALSSR